MSVFICAISKLQNRIKLRISIHCFHLYIIWFFICQMPCPAFMAGEYSSPLVVLNIFIVLMNISSNTSLG